MFVCLPECVISALPSVVLPSKHPGVAVERLASDLIVPCQPVFSLVDKINNMTRKRLRDTDIKTLLTPLQ